MTRNADVTAALNMALEHTNDRMMAAKLVMIALVNEGLSMQEAFEAVFGPGSYQKLIDATA